MKCKNKLAFLFLERDEMKGAGLRNLNSEAVLVIPSTVELRINHRRNVGTATLFVLIPVNVILLARQQTLDVDEFSLLEELTAGDVVLLSLIGQESDVQRLQVLVHVEVLLLVGTALLAFAGQVERAQSGHLHLLRFQQHLQQTRLELLHHTLHHIFCEDASVLGDVLGQPRHVHRLDALQTGVPLPVHHRLRVLDVVLVNFIKNFAHDIRLLSETYSGQDFPAFLSFTKVRNLFEICNFFWLFFCSFFCDITARGARHYGSLLTGLRPVDIGGLPLRRAVIIREVFAAWRQLVMLQRGQHLLQLQEEPFARFVAIRIHVEGERQR